MKKINKFLGLGLGVVAAFSLASCSNDVNEPNNTPDNEDVVLNLVKAPDFYAWSGSQVLGDTRGTRGWMDVTDPNTQETRPYYVHDEEVEINLSILDQHEDAEGEAKYGVGDLVAKLSVHVRTATDEVTVTLPMFADYVIDSDDLLIFNKHEILLSNISQAEHQFTTKIDEKPVNVTLTFSPETVEIEDLEGEVEEDEQPNQVIVKITGVNQDVIDYCMANYKDGLNFEIYIYLQNANTAANRTAFKNALDNSTVSFTGAPKYFINAYGLKYENGEKTKKVNPNDCKVKPSLTLYELVGEEKSHSHLNGSSYNTIYMYSAEGQSADFAHGGEGGDEPPTPTPSPTVPQPIDPQPE